MYVWTICSDCKRTDIIERNKIYGQLVCRGQRWSDHSYDTQCLLEEFPPCRGC